MTKPSLRWVFLVPILVTITVGFSVFAVYVDRVERNNRLADLDAELVRAERGGGAGPAGTEQSRPTPPPIDGPVRLSDVDSPIQLLIDPDGSIVSVAATGNPFSPSDIDALVAVDGFHMVTGQNYRVRVTSLDGRLTSLTALPLDPIDEATADFRRAVALGGTIILLLVAAVVWMLVRSTTRPIIQIAAVATRIADGELDTDIDAPSRSREMAALTDDLGRMLVRLRSSLDQSARSAVEANRARDDMQRFLVDMAHELRTPLTALKGYSDLYAGGMLEQTSDVDRAMARIGSESERLHRLADDMLQLARGASDTAPIEGLDLVVVAGAVADDLRAAYPDHSILLDVGPEEACIVRGVQGRIHQAILNLGSNACQHTSSGPDADTIVEIRLATDDQLATVSVIDHGPGVDPGDRDRVFLPFYRAEASRHRDGAVGAGLGLALVTQIADQHQGTVTLDETPGGGATFRLQLAMAPSAATTTE